jgi:hypothetical protein
MEGMENIPPAGPSDAGRPAAGRLARLGLGLLLAAWLVVLVLPPVLLLRVREGEERKNVTQAGRSGVNDGMSDGG